MPSSAADDPWAGERVARWLRQADGIERQLAPVSDVLFSAASLRPGERVLDIGCGTGPTTRRAAIDVGVGGSVTGLDVSADMLAAAATGPPDADAAPITWVRADVVDWSPPHHAHDVVISRFGVMFFTDPEAAFVNLASATQPGGRLAIAVWAHRDESELFEVPLAAALAVTRAQGIADPDGLQVDGGPFSLGDVADTERLLVRAGWGAVRCAVHDLDLSFVGGIGPDEGAVAAADLGPTRLVLAGLDDRTRAEAVASIATALRAHVAPDGTVVLGGRVVVFTAHRG